MTMCVQHVNVCACVRALWCIQQSAVAYTDRRTHTQQLATAYLERQRRRREKLRLRGHEGTLTWVRSALAPCLPIIMAPPTELAEPGGAASYQFDAGAGGNGAIGAAAGSGDGKGVGGGGSGGVWEAVKTLAIKYAALAGWSTAGIK
jgi:hypothetical protein